MTFLDLAPGDRVTYVCGCIWQITGHTGYTHARGTLEKCCAYRQPVMGVFNYWRNDHELIVDPVAELLGFPKYRYPYACVQGELSGVK